MSLRFDTIGRSETAVARRSAFKAVARDPLTLADALKEILKEYNVSQTALARSIGTSHQYVSNIVTGKVGASRTRINEIADAIEEISGKKLTRIRRAYLIRSGNVPLQPRTIFGELVREQRERYGASQKELAEAVRYSASTISKVERGVESPSEDLAKRIAFALDLNKRRRQKLLDSVSTRSRVIVVRLDENEYLY